MDINNLQCQYKVERDPDVRERLLMIIWLEKGKTSYEIGDLLGCPQSKVMYWKDRFKKQGMDGLRTRPRSGKPPKVLKDDMNRIRRKLESGASWQTKWVSDLIYQETGIVYSERHVVRLLHAWGFEKIRPRKEHIQADEKERKDFSKKTSWYWIRSPMVGT